MTFHRRLYFPLVMVLAGVLEAQHARYRSSTMRPIIEIIQVTSAPRSVQTSTFSSTELPPLTSTESRIESSKKAGHSTKAPRHHHEASFSSREDHGTDSGSDDWDYMEALLGSSPERRVLHQEEDRHVPDPRARMPTSPPPTTPASHHGAGHARGRNAHGHHAHPRPLMPHPPRVFVSAFIFGWSRFCIEAAAEDLEPFSVSDGSFHPKFEVVPGVGVYRLHARARSWEEARKVCEREGAQLAVPNSREEALALMEIHNRCPRLLPSHFNDYQYLGVHDLYSEGDWETIVGDPLNATGYMVWGRNQPDNAHHHGENCLSMNRQGFFNDVPCWTELPFICEHP